LGLLNWSAKIDKIFPNAIIFSKKINQLFFLLSRAQYKPNSALENSNAELTKKLLFKHFLSGLALTKSLIFVRPKGKIR